MKRPKTEHALQAEVVRFLTVNGKLGIFFFAVPNAGKRSPSWGARMKAEGLKSGVADLCILASAGTVFWLELKRTPKSVRSDAQKGFAAICERLGHTYALAHSFEEAIVILTAWGVLKPKLASP